MDKTKPMIKWQAPMKRVLYALVPVILASIYFFGWRALLILATVNAAGFLTEYLFCRSWKESVSSAVFVSGVLFALSLPPSMPVWMAILGIVFGVVFGKMVFGGFGKNIFNPALVGRAFLYVCFPVHMTTRWVTPADGVFGGFTAIHTQSITSATVLTRAAEYNADWSALFWGSVPGSLGETAAVWIILGGLFIVWKKAADYRIVISGFAGMLILQTAFWLIRPELTLDPVTAVLGGGFLLGLFFFATEPVSAPKTPLGKWLYGAFIGLMTVLIRVFSVWDEGMMFAVLLGNMFAPITDYAVRQISMKKKKTG